MATPPAVPFSDDRKSTHFLLSSIGDHALGARVGGVEPLSLPRRNLVLLAVGLLISALCLWVALHGVNAAEVAAAFAQARLGWVLPLLGVLGVFCVCKAWRWGLVLQLPPRGSLAPLTSAVVIGYAATSLLPLQLGEVARAVAAAQALRLRLAAIFVSILFERVLDVLALFLVLGAVLSLGGDLPAAIESAGYVLGALSAGLLVALVVYVGWTDAVLRFAQIVLTPLPAGFAGRVIEQLRAGAAGVGALRRPASWLPLAVASVAQWALMACCIGISCVALGLHVPIVAWCVVLALTIVGMSVPAGPGYVGSIQLAFVVGLQPFGVAPGVAIAASLFYHLLVCGSLIVAGVWAGHRLGGSFRSFLRADTTG